MMRHLLRGCVTTLLLSLASAGHTPGVPAKGRPIRSVDELDPSADYGSRHRIMDEYIIYVKKTCKSEMCLNGVRDRLLKAPHKCKSVKVLKGVKALVATCLRTATTTDLIGQLSTVPSVATVAANRAQVMIAPKENPAVRRQQRDNGRRKRARRDLQTATLSPYSWGIDRIDQPRLPLGGAGTAYNSSYLGLSGRNVEVIILDTGISMSHTQFGHLKAKISAKATGIATESAKDDGNGHGTHVASTAVGKTLGVARFPDLTLISFKVLTKTGSGTDATFLEGIDYAVTRAAANKAKRVVVNMSIGFGAVIAMLDERINWAQLTYPNLIFVAAAGNSNYAAGYASPASAARIVTVGASAKDDTKAYFSNFGDDVEVYAPGQDIVGASISSNSAYTTMSGTSMACPHVTGAIALLMAKETALAQQCYCTDPALPMSDCVYVRFLENSGATLMDRGYPILPHLAYLGRSSDFTCYAY